MTTDRNHVNVALRALVCLDLTNLQDDCDPADIDALCARAQTRHGSTAAVCIWPRFVTRAAKALAHTGIKVATVVNFPTGAEPLDDVLRMTERAVADGADEIDLVVPYRALAEGDNQAIEATVAAARKVCSGKTLKAILETGALGSPDLIRLASEQALQGGADFLKTSTGKLAVSATPEAAEIMLRAIATSGSGAGFKAAGGIRTIGEAELYLGLCDRIMGQGWAGPKHFRIGASSLLDALLAELKGTENTNPAEDD
jgi:deoxyribose-phosphate aldolase